MRLVTYKTQEQVLLGAIAGEHVIDLAKAHALLQSSDLFTGMKTFPADMIELLEMDQGLCLTAKVVDLAKTIINRSYDAEVLDISTPLNRVTLLPPVLRPTKVIGAGMNYHAFVSALNLAAPSFPVLFHKTSSALVGCGTSIIVPDVTKEPVPEGELAIIIGKRGKFINPAQAEDHIAGYACANDISARDLEFRTSQWTSGKMLETFCPLGPALVTRDEVSHLTCFCIETLLNGKTIQSGKTSDMIFAIPKLISEISSVVTLEIGDVILTGTPSDLGALNPPVLLEHGDVVTVRISGLGVLENSVYWTKYAPELGARAQALCK